MEIEESTRPSKRLLDRLYSSLAAGVGAVALVAAAPAGAWADQSNDNSTTTSATGGSSLVAPVTGALQANLACPANVNVLGNQRNSGNCAPGPQANSNSSSTTIAGGNQSAGLVGGPIVAPVTAAGQVNLSCPVNVNVLSNQGNSGNCAPGSQSNANSADTHVTGSGQSAGLLGGPLVAPITAGVGLNVTCPANVNVVSNQQASGDCVGTESYTSRQASGQTSEQASGQTSGQESQTPPGRLPSGTTTGTTTGTTSEISGIGFIGPTSAQSAPAEVVNTAFTEVPGPPDTGAFALGSVARLPALALLVLAMLVLVLLAGAATAVRGLRQERS